MILRMNTVDFCEGFSQDCGEEWFRSSQSFGQNGANLGTRWSDCGEDSIKTTHRKTIWQLAAWRIPCKKSLENHDNEENTFDALLQLFGFRFLWAVSFKFMDTRTRTNFKLEAQVEHQSEDGLDSLLSAGASVFQAISESICLSLVIFIRHRSHGQSMKLWRHCQSFQTTPPAVKTRCQLAVSMCCSTESQLLHPKHVERTLGWLSQLTAPHLVTILYNSAHWLNHLNHWSHWSSTGADGLKCERCWVYSTEVGCCKAGQIGFWGSKGAPAPVRSEVVWPVPQLSTCVPSWLKRLNMM